MDLWKGALQRMFYLEEVCFLKLKQSGNQVRGKNLQLRVVISHRSVVVTPSFLQHALKLGEFSLQFEKIRAGFNLG